MYFCLIFPTSGDSVYTTPGSPIYDTGSTGSTRRSVRSRPGSSDYYSAMLQAYIEDVSMESRYLHLFLCRLLFSCRYFGVSASLS